ncbi:hypothetical protein ACQ4PT_049881 [Festuca glaucescens]
MERPRMSTGDIPGGGGAPLLVRSYSAGSSTGGGVNEQREHSEERRWEGWEQRVGRLRRKAAEQRTRFYIVRRCLHMLLCWRDDTKH